MDFSTTELPPEAADLLSRVCPKCFLIIRVGDWPMCPHDPVTHFNVIDDSIPGGMIIENLSPEPQTFYSKSDWKKAMEKAGVVLKVQHRSLPGSDKSPHTQRWI